MKITLARLTTTDNPHDPFDDYPAWHQWDALAGYHTNNFLARLTASSDVLSDTDIALATEQAIDEIVEMNVLGIYKKVTKEIDDGWE